MERFLDLVLEFFLPFGVALWFVLALVLLALSGCGPAPLCDGYCDYSHNVDGYEVNVTERAGLRIDVPNGYDAEPLVDLVNAVDDCLRDVGDLPFDEAVSALCKFQRWSYTNRPMRRACFEVKVTTSWHWSHDFKYQLLYDEAPFESCAVKGFEAGPCYWRATVQNGYQVVVPPDAALLGEPLVRITTGCLAPYSSPSLARCASLSDGWVTVLRPWEVSDE